MRTRFLLVTVIVIVAFNLTSCKEGSKDYITEQEGLATIVPSTTSQQHSNGTSSPLPTAESTQMHTPLADQTFEALVRKATEGFEIEFVNAKDAAVIQSFPTPREDAIVHIIRRMEGGEKGWYRKDVLVVYPQSQQVKTHILMNGHSDDTYTTDSLTYTFGFLDEETILYTAVLGTTETATTYSLEKMNIYTGEKAVLMNGYPNNVSPDFFAKGWLTANKEKLVQPTFSKGELYVFNLKHHLDTTPDRKFPSSWPRFAIQRSPNGEQFWHDGKLYDLAGSLIAQLEDIGKYRLTLKWSPDNQYAAQHYAYDDGEEHRVSGGVEDPICPQGLVILNDHGNIIWRLESKGDLHLELVGWLPKKQMALIHYYQIDRSRPIDDQKITISLKALNLFTGETLPLRVGSLEKMEDVQLAETWLPYTRYQEDTYFVDPFQEMYWKPMGRNQYVEQLTDGSYILGTTDSDRGGINYFRLRAENKSVEHLSEMNTNTINLPELLFKQWLVFTDNIGLSYHIIP